MKIVVDMEHDPRLNKIRLKTLFGFLETPPPKLQAFDTSGKVS